MRKRIFILAMMLSAVGIIGTGCSKLNIPGLSKAGTAAQEETFAEDGESFEDENIEEAAVSTESQEDNYFENDYDSYEEDTDLETSVDAEGNTYKGGYVLIEKRKENLPVQAEVGYTSSVDIYAVISPGVSTETEESDSDEEKESKKESVSETTATPKQTEPETTPVESTPPETEPETIVYPNLVGQ